MALLAKKNSSVSYISCTVYAGIASVHWAVLVISAQMAPQFSSPTSCFIQNLLGFWKICSWADSFSSLFQQDWMLELFWEPWQLEGNVSFPPWPSTAPQKAAFEPWGTLQSLSWGTSETCRGEGQGKKLSSADKAVAMYQDRGVGLFCFEGCVVSFSSIYTHIATSWF